MAKLEDEQEQKPQIDATQPADGKITLIVRDQNHHETTFQVKTTTRFSKLMRAYCEKKGLDHGAVVFLYDGERLREEQTPQERGMSDKDQIAAVLHQEGGR